MKARRPRGRARGPTPDVDSSKERIHAAALALLARYGYEGLSLQMIADEVGLHKSSLFHHYRGKLELAREVFEAAVQRVVERVEPLAHDEPPRLDTLLAVSDALVDHFSEEPAAARLILAFMIAPEDSDVHVPVSLDDVDQPVVKVHALIWDWLERAKSHGAIRPVSLRQALLNFIGVMLMYPAIAGEQAIIAGPEPFSPKARKIRKEELRLLLLGALAPR